jgi:YggT family protein
MLAQTLSFLITTLGGLFALALMLRFMLQFVRAPARNPLSHFVVAITNFAVRPARRVVPSWRGFDLATLLLAWLVELLVIWLVLKLKGYELGSAVGTALIAIATIALIEVVKLAIYIVMGALIIQVIVSWVNPLSPIMPLLMSITRPFLHPFQKLIPPVANVDLSPLVLFLICQLLLVVPVSWIEKEITRWL